MKVVVLQENLSQALSIVSRSVASKPQVPVLGNVLIKEINGALVLMATNLEMGVRYTVQAKIDKGFEITVPAKQLTEFVSGMPKGQIELITEGDKLKINGGRFNAEVSGISSSEFPVIPQPQGEESIKVNVKDLLGKLSKVVFSAATDEGRPVLTGVMLDLSQSGMTIVSTDGYRLSKVELGNLNTSNGEKQKQLRLLIPAKSISELLRLGEEKESDELRVWITSEANQVIFKIGEQELVSRLIEGNFPDYKKIIPSEGSTKLSVDREELTRAIKLASIFARESANIVKFKIDGDNLVISANSPQLGDNTGEVEIKKMGENMEIAFNFRYLMEFLNNVSAEVVEMEFSGPLSPGVFRTDEDKDYLHIIMPVRVQS